MLLNHARAMAVAEVTRGGVSYQKNGQFTAEQQKAEDWEPVPIVTVPPVAADCGCGTPAPEKN